MDDQQLERAFRMAALLRQEQQGNPLSKEQARELADWKRENPDSQRVADELADAEQVAGDLARMEGFDVNAAKIRIAEKLGFQWQSTGKLRRLHWKRWMAAASILGVIATGVYLWQRSDNADKAKPTIARTVVNDVLPGRTGATLILGSGKPIDLDPSKNALITLDGNTRIENSNGTLVYANGAGNNAKAEYNTIITRRGQQYPVRFADGTYILVDANTTLKYLLDNGKGERRVEINGRAWFEVAHNAARPFIVSKGDRQVLVTGTHFDVNAYDEEPDMKVTLIEGGVKVSNGKNTAKLTPNQQAVISKQNEQIRVVKDADIEQATGWKEGTMVIHHADVATLMREISRWYDVDVVISPDVPARDLYFSVSRNSTLSELLKVFDNYKLHYQLDAAGKKLTVTP